MSGRNRFGRLVFLLAALPALALAADELGSHTMTLLTVRGVSPGSSVTVHVDTWPCAAECWSTVGAS